MTTQQVQQQQAAAAPPHVFGQPLNRVAAPGAGLPASVVALVAHLTSLANARASSGQTAPADMFEAAEDAYVQRMVQAMDCGAPLECIPVPDDEGGNAESAQCAVLLQYFRALPHPVLPPKLFYTAARVGAIAGTSSRVPQLRVFYAKLPGVCRAALATVLPYFAACGVSAERIASPALFGCCFLRPTMDLGSTLDLPPEAQTFLRSMIEHVTYVLAVDPLPLPPDFMSSPTDFKLLGCAAVDYTGDGISFKKGDRMQLLNSYAACEKLSGSVRLPEGPFLTGIFPASTVDIIAVQPSAGSNTPLIATPPVMPAVNKLFNVTVTAMTASAAQESSSSPRLHTPSAIAVPEAVRATASTASAPTEAPLETAASPRGTQGTPLATGNSTAADAARTTTETVTPAQPPPTQQLTHPRCKSKLAPPAHALPPVPPGRRPSAVTPASAPAPGEVLSPLPALPDATKSPVDLTIAAAPLPPVVGSSESGQQHVVTPRSTRSNPISTEASDPPEPRGCSHMYRIVVVGTGGVGKSAFTISFVRNEFIEEYDPTIEDSYRQHISVDGNEIVFDILDTAGQDEFSAVRDQYTRTGQGFLLMFSMVSNASFTQMRDLYTHVLEVKDADHVPCVLVGNKGDLVSEFHVSVEEATTMAKQFNDAPFLLASAKTRHNVEAAFHELARRILQEESATAARNPAARRRHRPSCPFL
eukprot:TRINITY_DN919_c0_g1_i6.p1 TRINITY_DN919_c0_g1~~TRINITY_DN919_c0_g1_i6.p1  ORF type:complete len:701 (-),score=168.24 TRINITY_DN919_c0_g1_i6:67-2169(-)